MPILWPNPKEKEWASSSQRLWAQTDNQELAQIFAGLSVLTCASTRPLCVRIAPMIGFVTSAGIKPRTDIVPYIEWDPRGFVALADDAANRAVDSNSDWFHVHEECLRRARQHKVNLRLCFDGALRGSRRGSAGVAVIAYYSDGHRDILYRGGKLLGDLSFSFLAEALALEWACEVLSSLGIF